MCNKWCDLCPQGVSKNSLYTSFTTGFSWETRILLALSNEYKVISELIASLIASCLKDQDGSVGMEFVKEIDLMNGLPFFMEKIGELMENSLPMEEDEDKKKPKQKKN